jgi:hypothetical protein
MKDLRSVRFAYVLIFASISIYSCISFSGARASEAWCGTAPLCSGECREGETQIKTSVRGDGAKCWSGHKALCTANRYANPCSGGPIWDIFVTCSDNGDDGIPTDCDGEPISEPEIAQSEEELTRSTASTRLLAALPPISNTWPKLSDGDCQLQNAKLVYHAQGYAEFTSQVRTNHAGSGGDSWVATLTAQDSNGHRLFTVPSFSSQSMKRNGHWYGWRVGFTFDPSKFSQIKKTDMKKHC